MFQSKGKLLITGEYFVLDSALALALPTKLGQTLKFKWDNSNLSDLLSWKSYDHQNQCWFSAQFSLRDFSLIENSNQKIANRLQEILRQVRKQNFQFLKNHQHITEVSTHLDFPNEWGLGTSSTLIASIANWAQIDPYILLENTFGGSGYDIACASANGPISYQRFVNNVEVSPINFNPTFQDQLYFVYLEKKQNSRDGIKHYRQKIKDDKSLVSDISDLTRAFIEADELTTFEQLIISHENIVSKTLKLERAKDLYFSDYWGQVKSLGAWGGDFVLVTSNRDEKETERYFNEKGFQVFIKYKDLIFNN